MRSYNARKTSYANVILQILYAYEDELGEDVIASLDFWGRPASPGTQQNEDGYNSVRESSAQRLAIENGNKNYG